MDYEVGHGTGMAKGIVVGPVARLRSWSIDPSQVVELDQTDEVARGRSATRQVAMVRVV